MNSVEYYISKKTCAIKPNTEETCIILEDNKELLFNKPIMDVINDSCIYYGSSYDGRVIATKKILNMNYKLPIMVDEYNEVIFFPTSSPRFSSCIWINLDNIDTYEKNGNYSKIIFKNGFVLNLEISYYSLENQIFRATMLESLIRKRKNMEK